MFSFGPRSDIMLRVYAKFYIVKCGVMVQVVFIFCMPVAPSNMHPCNIILLLVSVIMRQVLRQDGALWVKTKKCMLLAKHSRKSSIFSSHCQITHLNWLIT